MFWRIYIMLRHANLLYLTSIIQVKLAGPISTQTTNSLYFLSFFPEIRPFIRGENHWDMCTHVFVTHFFGFSWCVILLSMEGVTYECWKGQSTVSVRPSILQQGHKVDMSRAFLSWGPIHYQLKLCRKKYLWLMLNIAKYSTYLHTYSKISIVMTSAGPAMGLAMKMFPSWRRYHPIWDRQMVWPNWPG